ncbi:outer membrane lipoprotein carrier protein LolA [Streptomyces sp. NPDC091272]|uniref:LolA family protein n=1 Tax=Streptomyces sp. NPDC091272 TaxID=3365981 RepID=UPI003819355F
MAPNGTAQSTSTDGTGPVRRRKAARYVVPVAVAGVAAATIGLVPALANAGDPDLPQITAQQLIEKMAASDTQQLSGTVKVSTDLGLPSLDGLAGSFGGATGGKGEDGSGADPQAKLMQLASGTHTLRVAADGPDRQKISLLDDAAEYSLIHNGDEVWAYDSASNEAFHAKAPKDAGHRAEQPGKQEKLPEGMPTTPKQFAEQALKMAGKDTSVTVDGSAQVAGRDAYQLLIKPKQTGSTVGEIRVAVDAETGTPLKFTLLPSAGGKAVVDAGFTKVDFAAPAASTFDFSPPKGAKVTEADRLKEGPAGKNDKELQKEFGKNFGKSFENGEKGLGKGGGVKVIGEGWTSVAQLGSGDRTAAPGTDAGQRKEQLPAEAQGLLDSLGDKVSGKFGEGRIFSTRLVNALMTDDGKVYVGAVTKDALLKAANAAE